jgi:type IV fimbrial biogenesis protein FimT
MRGVSLIELMIGLAIMAILLTIGLPAFTVFLQNTQIKNGAQTALAGITLARAEAIRRNVQVRFSLVSNLTSGCTLSASSLNWVVSQSDPTGKCDRAASETLAPLVVQKKSASEGTKNVVVAATGGSTLVFNGLGRVVGAGITQLDFSNSTGTCEHLDATNGKMRCLRIMVSTGGQAKLCDPKATDPTDSRNCS